MTKNSCLLKLKACILKAYFFINLNSWLTIFYKVETQEHVTEVCIKIFLLLNQIISLTIYFINSGDMIPVFEYIHNSGLKEVTTNSFKVKI